MTEIKGTVVDQIVCLEQCTLFAVQQKDGCYLIISENRQACKDDVFVRKGQKIRLQGGVLDGKAIKGIMITNNAEIVLRQSDTADG